MGEPSSERHRIVRGLILRFLAKVHPAPLYITEVLLLLDDLGFSVTKEELTSHIAYLEEGKLIKVEKSLFGTIEFIKIFVTRNGLNINNGFDVDIGIDSGF